MPDKTTPHIQRAAKAVAEYRNLYPDDPRCITIATLVLSTTLEPSEEEIEAGARAMCESLTEVWVMPFHKLSKYARRMVIDAARAALSAAARVRVGE